VDSASSGVPLPFLPVGEKKRRKPERETTTKGPAFSFGANLKRLT
jgi:hypothetical protein